MQFGWKFDRGQTAIGEIVPIKCRFVFNDENGAGQTTMEIVIPEESAQRMLADLAQVANPPSDLVIAQAIPPQGDLRQ